MSERVLTGTSIALEKAEVRLGEGVSDTVVTRISLSCSAIPNSDDGRRERVRKRERERGEGENVMKSQETEE